MAHRELSVPRVGPRRPHFVPRLSLSRSPSCTRFSLPPSPSFSYISTVPAPSLSISLFRSFRFLPPLRPRSLHEPGRTALSQSRRVRTGFGLSLFLSLLFFVLSIYFLFVCTRLWSCRSSDAGVLQWQRAPLPPESTVFLARSSRVLRLDLGSLHYAYVSPGSPPETLRNTRGCYSGFLEAPRANLRGCGFTRDPT